MDAARKRAVVETYARNEATLRRTALRYSLCLDDAEDALQRGLEILLRKAPSDDPRVLVKWTQTVVKHEAMAVRRERERILAGPAAVSSRAAEDWVALLPASADGPPERAERRESIARSREALRALKPHELRALTLLAEGYSYVEIGEITGWSQSKVNKSLVAGRERFRRLIARSEDGSRCAEMRVSISAFCDGEAGAEQIAELREHLRGCVHCRATLRAYRAAPAAAAALAPALPLHRSLWERAQDAVHSLSSRFGGGEPLTQVASGGGAGGVGIAGIAKVAAICIGTAGGAAACVAGGLVPSPVDLAGKQGPPRLERHLADAPPPAEPTPTVTYEPAPLAPDPQPASKPRPSPPQEPPAESEPVASEPAAVEGAAVESAPPPEPAAEPVPVASTDAGSPAGEFGP